MEELSHIKLATEEGHTERVQEKLNKTGPFNKSWDKGIVKYNSSICTKYRPQTKTTNLQDPEYLL